MASLPLASLGIRILALVLIAGLATATLVHFSPAWQVDETELDPRLRPESVESIRERRRAEKQVFPAVVRHFRQMAAGDLGYSVSRNAPIGDLLRQGAGPTAALLTLGLFQAWTLGLGSAAAVAFFRRLPALDTGASILAAVLLSLPAAFIAYLSVSFDFSMATVVAATLSPRIFHFSRRLLRQAYGASHIDMARARGLTEARLFIRHVIPSVRPQLFALASASIAMGVGACIPIEVICDSPGLGRMAWQAAMARDLPLLINLTMIIGAVLALSASLFEWAGGAAERVPV